MSRCVLGLFGLLSALVSSQARAQGAPLPAAAARDCDRQTSAIQRCACALVSAISGQADSALVVAGANAEPSPVALPSALGVRLARAVAERLGTAARASPTALRRAEAERSASSSGGLIYLDSSVSRDRLEVRADVYTGAGHFWQRLRAPGLKIASHAIATSPLDQELRALFPTIPIAITRLEKASLDQPDIVALACGDVRGDGSTEFVVVGRHQVQVGQLLSGRFQARGIVDWASISNVAARPLREPIASCWIAEPGRIWIGLSDRADALELSAGLHVEHEWHGIMPWSGGGGCTRRVGLGYEGRTEACPGSQPSSAVDFGNRLDAFASRSLADRSGQPHTLRVARPLGTDVARVFDSLQAEVTLPDAGAQIAVGDLDDDGLAEIITSSPNLDRASDQLVVRTLSDRGQLRERLRLPVPSGIDALAICPADGRTMASVAIATGRQIWVIR